jgi:pimeloyl-ACP methyl ester carboxylesterase
MCNAPRPEVVICNRYLCEEFANSTRHVLDFATSKPFTRQVIRLEHTYFPHDLSDTPAHFQLEPLTVETTSGAMYVLHGRFRPASTRVTVFLHGVGASWTTWTPMLEAAGSKLADLGNVLLVDLPGFGASEPSPASLDATAIGQALVQACAQVEYREMDLVGHSMGGYLAMAMASNRAPEIKAVCCLSGAYFSVVAAAARPASAALHHPRASVYYRAQVALSLLGPIAPGLLAALARLGLTSAVLRPFLAHPRRALPRFRASLSTDFRGRSFRMAARNAKSHDPRTDWPRIAVPVFGLFGVCDRFTGRADVAEFRRVLPGANVTLFDEAGHFSHIEQPTATFDWIRRSLASARVIGEGERA